MTLHGMIASHTAGTNMLINVTKKVIAGETRQENGLIFFIV